jgi:hypothetical protein
MNIQIREMANFLKELAVSLYKVYRQVKFQEVAA